MAITSTDPSIGYYVHHSCIVCNMYNVNQTEQLDAHSYPRSRQWSWPAMSATDTSVGRDCVPVVVLAVSNYCLWHPVVVIDP